MKQSVEVRYISLFTFSLAVTVVMLVISINKLQPLLFERIFTSCTQVYQSITANSVVISTVFVLGLLLLFVSLSLKLLLSSYRTSQRLSDISRSAQKSFPHKLQKVLIKLGVSRKDFIVTNHTQPLAVTAGLLNPKVVLSKSIINHLTEKELEAVVLHELYHQQHKHGLLYVGAEAIAASLTAIVPILKDVIQSMKLDFENMADQHAARYQGSTLYVFSALHKLSGKSLVTPLPSFSAMMDKHLRSVDHSGRNMRGLSKKKLIFSVVMVMALSFFAAMPVETAQTTTFAQQSVACEPGQTCSNVCVNRISIGMSKFQNYSSILPASMF